MFSTRRFRVLAPALAVLPTLMGQGCPAPIDSTPPGTAIEPAEPTSLLIVSLASVSTVPAQPTVLDFNPVEAGKIVTMSVEGNATGSRVDARIVDNLGNLVAQEMLPTTAQTTVSFTSTTTGSHRIFLRERGAPSSLYEVLVVQQP